VADAEVVCAEVASIGAADLTVLSRAEQQRAARFHRPVDAHAWAAARAVLRGVLGSWLDVPPAEVEIEPGERGRPRLGGGRSGLWFNLSHAGGLVLVATSTTWPVGVDVEPRRAVPDLVDVARRVLRPEVVATIVLAPPAARGDTFLRAWVRHEARLKCRGTGIVEPNEDDGGTDDLTIVDVPVGRGHVAAVAVACPEATIEIVDGWRPVRVP
jgi:4'-phosphopantetheinyl transferase